MHGGYTQLQVTITCMFTVLLLTTLFSCRTSQYAKSDSDMKKKHDYTQTLKQSLTSVFKRGCPPTDRHTVAIVK